MKRGRLLSWLGGASLLVVILHASVAYTDWAYVDAHTGSQRGHREWRFGWRTGSWYQKSELEAFMQEAHPDILSHRWISYSGTGRTVTGIVRSRGHGSPFMIYTLMKGTLDAYCERVSDAEKLQLYHVLSSGNEEAVQAIANEIFEVSLSATRVW